MDELFDVFDAPARAPAKRNAKRKASPATSPPPSSSSSSSSAAASAVLPDRSAAHAKHVKRSSSTASSTSSRAVEKSVAGVGASSSSSGSASSAPFGRYVEQRIVKTKTLAEDGCDAIRCYPPHWDFGGEDVDDGAATGSAASAGDGEGDVSMRKVTTMPANPAKTYPFQLDPFQLEAVACIERNQSVLVAAHTSAGKTVCAEYAIALCLRENQRVIYTSPIKALSNQKYRELHEEFQDVGLMTGDVTINPSASCLVMTTEILRNMLYRGSEVMREVAWVVFDEIHYMRDKHRGVVWEETLILLPHSVRFVFLSATIPNSPEFAMWIAKLHDQPCEVVFTDYRPTPLQHYIFPSGAEGVYLVVDSQGVFREGSFQKALAVLGSDETSASSSKAGGGKKRKRQKKTQRTDMNNLITMVMKRKYDPVIVFCFSKRDCEENALALTRMDLTTESEKKLVTHIFTSAIDSLGEDDRKLPQIQSILPLLKRGIGIHHGGLLPILKEVIEILFGEGLVKCLFATETFAMGVNMPAKTVVFTSCRKFDGEGMRALTSGEYIQMSGRAGRRGLDDRGLVFMMLDAMLEPAAAKNMIKGTADPLLSSFYLGYNMILNLLRVEEADPEYIIERSFRQFQAGRAAPRLAKELEEVEKEIAAIEEANDGQVTSNENDITEYHHLRVQLDSLGLKLRAEICKPLHIIPFLNPGRLLHIVDGTTDWGWGVFVSFRKQRVSADSPIAKVPGVSIDASGHTYIVDMLLNCDPDSVNAAAAAAAAASAGKATKLQPTPCPPGVSGVGKVVPVLLHTISELSSIRVFLPPKLKSSKARATVVGSIAQVHKRFPDGVPLLDPVEDMKIADEEFLGLVRRIEALEARLFAHPFHQTPERDTQYGLFLETLELRGKADKLRDGIRSATRDMQLLQQLKNMMRVLRRLELTTPENVIAIKGRVACEVESCDELLATELIFGGVFNELAPEQTAALCSCLIFDDRTEQKTKLKEELAAPLRQMQEAARRIAQVKNDARMTVDVDEYVSQFRPEMMDVVYAWCKGAKFSEICKMTDVFEGSIIRCMRRLEELLRQLASASKAIGNDELETKFNSAIAMIKRDIIFAASLYL